MGSFFRLTMATAPACGLAVCLLGSHLPPQGHPAPAHTDPRDRLVTIHLKHVEIATALERVFRGTDLEYQAEPDLKGKVDVDLESVPFETALSKILGQVHGTYRGPIYICMNKEFFGPEGSPVPSFLRMPEYRPGRYSAAYAVRNRALFLTPHRTMGGTFDLLAEAARSAGLDEWSAFRYGPNGFAMVLPPAGIRQNGNPLQGEDRSRFQPDVAEWDFRSLTKSMRGAIGARAYPCRLLVLLVTPDPVKFGGASDHGAWPRPSDSSILPDSVRMRKWRGNPDLTVLVYEFQVKHGSLVLKKQGEAGISGRAHVLRSHLWNANQLR